MLVYSSEHFHSKVNGHCYEYYSRDAICGNCGIIIGRQTCYNYSKGNKDKREYYFEDREKNNYKFCPYCGKPLYTL